jgi:hypothetical protein
LFIASTFIYVGFLKKYNARVVFGTQWNLNVLLGPLGDMNNHILLLQNMKNFQINIEYELVATLRVLQWNVGKHNSGGF